MAIKEQPINYRTYFRLFKEEYISKLQGNEKILQGLIDSEWELYTTLKENIANGKCVIDPKVLNSAEFKENKYIDGSFFKYTKGAFIASGGDFDTMSDYYDVYKVAKAQKHIYEVKKDIEFCKKVIALSFTQYTDILKTYYTEVHKKLVLEGAGYVFDNNIGWICINRCHLKNPRKLIDYQATKQKKEELLKAGERIYNKEEAEWCEKNGIDYKVKEFRVFRKDEYCYEIPLLGCKLANGRDFKLDIADYRHRSIRGKTNDDLLEETKGDLNKICELPIDLKTKLTLCNKSNKMLYTKFIRNESQNSINFRSTNRKDR